MKRKLMLLVLLSSLFLGGCSMTDSPEELTHPPKLEGEKEDIKLALKDYLPQNTRPIIPPTDGKGSAIKLVDLDGDGEEEAIVFYSIELEENPIRVLVLKKENERWVNKAEIKVIGQDLDKVMFKDLDGDGGLEIIIGSKIKYSVVKKLSVYSMHKGDLEILFKSDYDDLLVDDLNNDKQAEILVLNANKETGESFGEVHKYLAGKVKKIDTITFNNKASINYVKYDYIYKNKKGIIISTTTKEDYINIYLFKMEGEKLKNLLSRGLIQTKKETNTDIPLPKDINKDGVIEFAIPNKIQDNKDEGKINWVTEWYSFDGKDNIEPKALNYYDEKLNFTFDLPLKWKDKLTITNLTRNENTIREEEFIRLDYKKDENSETTELFTIYIYSKDKLKRLEDNKIKEKAIKILEDGENVYYLERNEKINSGKLEHLADEVEKIEKTFRFIEG